MKTRRTFIKSASALAAASGVLGIREASAETGKSTKGMMLHNVYFWLKPTVTEADRKAFEQGLRTLVKSIKEVSNSDIGVPAATPKRDVVDQSFGYSLFIRFKSMADHDAYQKHAAHQKFVQDHSALWEKVVVYDSSVI